MAKYIDADKLIAEIERRKNRSKRRLDNIVPLKRKDTIDEEQLVKIELRDKVDKAYLNGVWVTLCDILSFITSLQQEQSVPSCKTCGFYENNCPFIRGKLIPYPNKVCKDYTYSVMKDQPEVDFDREITHIWGKCAAEPKDQIACLHIESFIEIARHFYELGLNASKEENE